ncbi:MAG: hypothetical protein QM758_16425 [Armatimonas sp.]
MVIIGRYEKILRYGYGDKEAVHKGGQHILYSVSVERYFKGSGPLCLKVLQNGGPLPVITYLDQLKHGVYEDNNPPPRLGDRQLLFLRHSGKALGRPWNPADTREFNKLFLEYRDELWPILPLKSRILFQGGRALSVAPKPYDHWRYGGGPQLIDMPEAESIRNLLSAL